MFQYRVDIIRLGAALIYFKKSSIKEDADVGDEILVVQITLFLSDWTHCVHWLYFYEALKVGRALTNF